MARRFDTITNRLSHSENIINRHVNTWKTKLNTTKTEAIRFTKRRLHYISDVVINNEKIEWYNCVKLLGVHTNMKFYDHLKKVDNKTN